MLCQEKEKRQPAVVRAGVLTGERNRKNDAIIASNGCKKSGNPQFDKKMENWTKTDRQG